jgi:pimeloyl-ACP methyl ester carboxylesterase
VSLEPCRALASALGAPIVVVPGAGHVVNLEAREAVNESLRSFLEGLPPA